MSFLQRHMFYGLLLSALLFTLSTQIQANEKVVLQLKWKHQFQFAGFYAAQNQGYFAEEGLDVEFREINFDRSPLEMVLSGEAQYGISDSSLVVARMQGKKPVVLAAVFQNSPMVLLTLASSDIVSPLDLVNKKVMYLRDTDDAVLHAMFTEMGIHPDQFTHVPHSFNDDDLISGKVDAISAYITDQPFYFREKDIAVNIISPSNYGIDFYGDMIFVEEQYLKANKKQAMAFRRAALKGWRYAIEHREEMARWIKDNLAPHKSIENLLYEAEMTSRIIRADVIDLGYFSSNRMKRIADIYKSSGKAPASADYSGIDYLEHMDSPYLDKKWVQAAFFLILILAVFIASQWYNNIRLKARVQEKTLKLLEANGSMQQYLKVIDRYVNATVLTSDLEFKLVSKAWCHLTGFHAKELIGTNFGDMIYDQQSPAYSEMKQAISANMFWTGELMIRDNNGHRIWINTSVQPNFRTDQIREGIALIATDISDTKRIVRLSRTDSLTGLANRRAFDESFDRELLRLKRSKSKLSLMMIDVDFFKQFNDLYGHLEGDQCLQKIAVAIRLCAKRPADMAVRYGGEEFLLFLPETDHQGALSLAQTLQEKMERLKIEHRHSSVSQYVTVSVGIATMNAEHLSSSEKIILIADQMLYKAKSLGRNRICTEPD